MKIKKALKNYEKGVECTCEGGESKEERKRKDRVIRKEQKRRRRNKKKSKEINLHTVFDNCNCCALHKGFCF